MNQIVEIRPSGALKYEECGYAYFLQYVERFRSRTKSANLAFGTSVHTAISAHLHYLCGGKPVDIEKVFEETWEKEVTSSIITYSSIWNEAEMRRSGLVLVRQFPDAWDKTGLMPVIDSNGKPMIERRYKQPLPGNVLLSGEMDVVGMTMMGQVGVVDFKSPATPSSEEFMLTADQLTYYQILMESRLDEVGIDKIDFLGFFELIKRKISSGNRGKGPTIMPFVPVPARTPEQVEEAKHKLAWIAEDIRKGRFPKRPRMAYNSPCDLCDNCKACVKKDWSDLVRMENCPACGAEKEVGSNCGCQNQVVQATGNTNAALAA